MTGWLTALPGAEAQRELDRWAIEDRGIPGLELMERAGSGLAYVVDERAPSGRIAIVCGKGNNGGDGFVAARVLRERGREVTVLVLVDPGEYRGDALTNLERLPGAPPEPFTAGALEGAVAIVDALLGTGFAGTVREPYESAIVAIIAAGSDALVVACDVPSGVNASTGEVAGTAVYADITVTFHAAKPGLWIAPGKGSAGEVQVVDIGIPRGGPGKPDVGLIEAAVTDGVPRRGPQSTKFAAGNVLVCGGSTGLTGAVCMASEAAMRAGAGYVTVLVPASLDLIFEVRLLEVMSVPLADEDGALSPLALDEALARTARAEALVLGPGLGRSSGAAELARQLAARAAVPLLLDADGLNAHVGIIDRLASRTAATVLTPHAGELGRLLGRPSEEIASHRLASVREAARCAGAVVVLKGDDTLVAEPGGYVAVNKGGVPALSTAGTGDVLSGVIAAYVAKGMSPFHAACAGVFVHAQAGRIAAREVGPEGVLASDVIAMLPRAFSPGDDQDT